MATANVALLAAALLSSAAAQQQGNLWAWCQSGVQKGWPICDPSAPIDARAADIVSRLNADDKINALVTNNYFENSLGLPPYNWWSEATHGISRASTLAARPVTTSCSFSWTLGT